MICRVVTGCEQFAVSVHKEVFRIAQQTCVADLVKYAAKIRAQNQKSKIIAVDTEFAVFAYAADIQTAYGINRVWL